MDRCHRPHRNGEECSACETFVCAACQMRVSWAVGGDSELCDDCWVCWAKEEKRNG